MCAIPARVIDLGILSHEWVGTGLGSHGRTIIEVILGEVVLIECVANHMCLVDREGILVHVEVRDLLS